MDHRNARYKVIKLLENNTGQNLGNLRFDDLLDIKTHYFSVNYIPTHKDPNIEYPPTNLDYAGDMSWEESEAFYDTYYQNIIQRLDSIMEIKSLVEIYEEIY